VATGGDQRHQRGRTGEQLAALDYQRRGFAVVAMRQRTRAGEIDLVLRRKALLVAVEVKTRGADLTPETAVDQARLDRLRRALWLLAAVTEPRPRRLRVDVAAVRIGPPVEVRSFPGDEFAAG
jgi:putative endonuclease